MENSTGKAVCPYCGVGCVIRATVQDNKITRISADDDVAPNYGMLCPKGARLKQVFQNHDGRLAYPIIRDRRGDPPAKFHGTRLSLSQQIGFTKSSWSTARIPLRSTDLDNWTQRLPTFSTNYSKDFYGRITWTQIVGSVCLLP